MSNEEIKNVIQYVLDSIPNVYETSPNRLASELISIRYQLNDLLYKLSEVTNDD